MSVSGIAGLDESTFAQHGVGNEAESKSFTMMAIIQFNLA